MNGPSWFHVFDSTRSLWLQYDGTTEQHAGRRFANHGGAAEFASYEDAQAAALECMAKGPHCREGDLIILADYGVVESPERLP